VHRARNSEGGASFTAFQFIGIPAAILAQGLECALVKESDIPVGAASAANIHTAAMPGIAAYAAPTSCIALSHPMPDPVGIDLNATSFCMGRDGSRRSVRSAEFCSAQRYSLSEYGK
jgi:hypothetical protein